MNKSTVQDLLTGKIPVVQLSRWTPEIIAKTICAFANDYENKGAGYLLLELAKTAKIEEEINALLKCCHSISPQYTPSIKVIEGPDSPRLILWLPRGMERPYSYGGSIFLQSRGESRLASQEEQSSFLELLTRPSFDDCIHPEAKIEDICLPMVYSFLEKIKHPLWEKASTMDAIKLYNKLGLIGYTNNHARPKNLALLLFSLTPSNFFPHHTIRVTRYYDDKKTCFTRKSFAGSLFLQRRALMDYFQNAVLLEYFNDTEECANYPYIALWEAVNNALLHKDYSSPNSIDIRITPEYISITNPVSKEEGLSAEECKQGIFALRPSTIPLVEGFLQEMHSGAGLMQVEQALKENGSPSPVFSLNPQGDAFTIKIVSHPTFCNEEQKERFSRGLCYPPKNSNAKMREAVRKAIISTIQDNPCVSLNALAQSFRLSKSTIYHHLSELKQEGILMKQGKGMSQHWVIINKG